MNSLKVLMMPDYRQDNPYQQLLANGIELNDVTVSFPQGYRRVLPILRAAVRRGHKVEIVHLHWLEGFLRGTNWLTKLVYAAKFLVDVTLTRLVGVRVVWTIHDQREHDAPYPQIEYWVRQTLMQLANRLIVHSLAARTVMLNDYRIDPQKIVVIPHGHYRSVYGDPINQQVARQALSLPLDGKIYLNFGMLRPYKGIEQLLQAWQESQPSLQDSHLIIAGKPISLEYGRHLTTLVDKTENISFFPEFIENDKIHLFLCAADIVVLPYRSILTSGSTLLAMTYGKPVIAPKLGGIPEVLGAATTLLYDPEQPSGLALALKHSHHCDLEQLSQLTVLACSSLNWDGIGQKMALAYQQSVTMQHGALSDNLI